MRGATNLCMQGYKTQGYMVPSNSVDGRGHFQGRKECKTWFQVSPNIIQYGDQINNFILQLGRPYWMTSLCLTFRYLQAPFTQTNHLQAHLGNAVGKEWMQWMSVHLPRQELLCQGKSSISTLTQQHLRGKSNFIGALKC